eukprot:CAMPEP_0194762922 /NCGR_PEP_ID=MMETSP0323_2-20130528/17147_1 /TAXON_ID=2866 ORGANISM="Crypthecodinium cohnii, Strain Seligo" /NCGR_SAMPLE_ID=MMETSP0323_2 /ASSEMBLY_ACC=CAM_ASM_000346 /LENGTH=120 /DNA_ID=CAMNT_0039686403 /DNA_START=42 /DNA_END=400 /DNA_ORIENTATION=-
MDTSAKHKRPSKPHAVGHGCPCRTGIETCGHIAGLDLSPALCERLCNDWPGLPWKISRWQSDIHSNILASNLPGAAIAWTLSELAKHGHKQGSKGARDCPAGHPACEPATSQQESRNIHT